MNCEYVQDLLLDGGEADASLRRAALEHLSECQDCRDAQYAVAALHGSRLQRIPPPTPGAMERAIAAAVGSSAAGDGAHHDGRIRRAGARSGFWSGVAVGGSLAAALAIAWIVTLSPQQTVPAGAATPEVTLALNETRDVNIAVESPMALRDAEIHVQLTGAIELSGFEDQRELRWRTNLEAGSNQLTLPVVALGPRGGQVLVEVLHRDKRRKFVVDVRSSTEA